MKHHLRPFTSIYCLLTIILFLSVSASRADDQAKRILILPFGIHSEKDLTFLNKGIMDMLALRIGQSASVLRQAVTPPGSDPVRLGRDLNADYVITGSLTFFGKDVSTDAALARIDTGETALQFSRLDQNGGDVLKNIDRFATQVSQYLTSLSNLPPDPTAPKAPAPAAVLLPTASTTTPISPPAATAAGSVAQAPSAAAPVGATISPAPIEEKALWVSSPFKGTISALTTADVNGDGRTEIVVCHEKKIVVHTKIGHRLSRLAVFDAGSRHTVIGVDAGDINGNTKSEIFVTRLNAQGNLDAVVVELNGTKLEPIATKQKWYFRILTDPETEPMLMGQRRGIPSGNDTGGLYADPHFLPGVFQLTWVGNAYQPGGRLPIPRDLNIYRFTRGDIFNDGKTRTIAYSPADELRIFDPAGTPQWAGKQTLGGSPLFLQAPSLTDANSKDRTYLTQRLMVADLDDDGTMEVITAHNRDAAKGFVERYRKYTRGRMLALRWSAVNMKTIWSGEEVGGYISDFSLADLNGDGKLEAVYAMVTSTGLTQSKSSHIVVERIGNLPDEQ